MLVWIQKYCCIVKNKLRFLLVTDDHYNIIIQNSLMDQDQSNVLPYFHFGREIPNNEHVF
jgi:hypothetical protein